LMLDEAPPLQQWRPLLSFRKPKRWQVPALQRSAVQLWSVSEEFPNSECCSELL